MEDRIEIFMDPHHWWRWRRVTENDEVVAGSAGGYEQQNECMRAAIRVNQQPYILEVLEEDFTLVADTTQRTPES